MLTIEGYNIFYNTAHLLEPKPKTYEEVIARLEKLECNLFYNIISSPNCRYERRFSKNRIKEHYKNMSAEDRFKNIFVEKKLYANPKSFFVNKLNIHPRDCESIKSVSFTLSKHDELSKHFEARGSEYGICFFHDFLQNKGIRPVTYVNENDPEKNKKYTFNSPHLIEVYSGVYDMRWENEWRINTDLEFSQENIAFVIVPQEKHEYFVEWFMGNADFENVIILSSNAFKSNVDHLISYPQQTDNSWHQVEIFRDSNTRGLKVDPEDFNDIDISTKRQFQEKHAIELDCFSKSIILQSYDYAYVSRFIKFKRELKDIEKLGDLFSDYIYVEENLTEPEDAQRDIVLSLFGHLFNVYPVL